MTTMLDRYLYAIRSYLPERAASDDVVAEVADELQSRVEERESALGRPLTPDEEASVIKAYGHPRVVASRYARAQYLIGPELFPFFLITLRNVLVCGLAIVLLCGGIASILMRDGTIFFDTIGVAWNTAWWLITVVTIIFIVAERAPNREPDTIGPFGFGRWDPRQLPAPSTVPSVKWHSSIIEFGANFIALLVLLDAAGARHRIPLVVGAAHLLAAHHAFLTSAWYATYVAALLGTALVIASAITVFVRPGFSAMHEAIHVLSGIVTSAGLLITLASGPLIIAPDAGWNTTARCFLVVAVVLLLISVASSLRKLLRVRSPFSRRGSAT